MARRKISQQRGTVPSPNEGNFQYGNATLSYYDPETKQVENEIFKRANGFKLGDVAQSMTIRDGVGWVVVNNSHVIFAIDINTFKEVGRIINLTSPRYIHFLSDEKAYVTQIWDNRIFIVNPKRYEITGCVEISERVMQCGFHGAVVQYAVESSMKLLVVGSPHPENRHRTEPGGR